MIYQIRGKEIEAKERLVWSRAEQGRWEPETFDVLDKYIVPDKVFIDLGAWCGILSLYAEKLGARVYAIEPDPIAFEELSKNVILNDSFIDYQNMAICDRNEKVKLFSNTIDGFGNSESNLLAGSGCSCYVEGYTLEKAISEALIPPQNICLIKMDVEGSEIMILKQAKEWLAKHRPPMWISFHPGYFEDSANDPRMLTLILFPFYNCVGHTAQEFRDILRNPNAFHTFLFLPR